MNGYNATNFLDNLLDWYWRLLLEQKREHGPVRRLNSIDCARFHFTPKPFIGQFVHSRNLPDDPL